MLLFITVGFARLEQQGTVVFPGLHEPFCCRGMVLDQRVSAITCTNGDVFASECLYLTSVRQTFSLLGKIEPYTMIHSSSHYVRVVHVPSRLAPPNVECSTYFSSNSRSYSAKLRSFSSASRLWPHPPRKFPVGIWTSQRLNRAAITTPPTLNRDSASTCESSTSWTAR